MAGLTLAGSPAAAGAEGGDSSHEPDAEASEEGIQLGEEALCTRKWWEGREGMSLTAHHGPCPLP